MFLTDSVKKDFSEREKYMKNTITTMLGKDVEFGIFGSYARNDHKASSDIDFCVIFTKDIPLSVRGKLKETGEEHRCDVVFVSKEYFLNDGSLFAKNLRRDYIPCR